MGMQLQKILEQTIPALGFELVDVEITPAKTIRIFMDKECGVNVGDCELVSNHLSRLLVVENIDYNRLEISSPGIERSLKKLQDYVRFVSHLVKIKTRELINEQKVFQGYIAGVEGEVVQLTLENGEVMKIAFSDIVKARLVFEDKKAQKLKKTKSKK